ncbi:P-II family nitrogen regulator [Eudoraea adriatica]|uniref:P-II family nitrogen regulator n=1 Tax=Eudoraea adriatica TaxID=446681 RepID=UPI00037CC597|nr:P-II family nitrogen regulator [Eudoraea adriatica]
MIKIEAKIRKSKFKEVKRTLIKEGFESFNYHLTRCISKKSEKRFYRGVEFDTISSERIDFSIYINDKDVKNVLDIIVNTGTTGDADDSLIGVFKLTQAFMVKNSDGSDKLIEKI